MNNVYLLWYVREWDEGEDTELLIGVYRSKADATETIERLKGQPGFVAHPEGFEIHDYEVGKDHWTEGFARMIGDVDLLDSH
jgi:hypothetical protein